MRTHLSGPLPSETSRTHGQLLENRCSPVALGSSIKRRDEAGAAANLELSRIRKLQKLTVSLSDLGSRVTLK